MRSDQRPAGEVPDLACHLHTSDGGKDLESTGKVEGKQGNQWARGPQWAPRPSTMIESSPFARQSPPGRQLAETLFLVTLNVTSRICYLRMYQVEGLGTVDLGRSGQARKQSLARAASELASTACLTVRLNRDDVASSWRTPIRSPLPGAANRKPMPCPAVGTGLSKPMPAHHPSGSGTSGLALGVQWVGLGVRVVYLSG